MKDVVVEIIGPTCPKGKTFKLSAVCAGPDSKSNLTPGKEIESRKNIYLKSKGERHYINMDVYNVMSIFFKENGFKNTTFFTPNQLDQLAALNMLKEYCEEREGIMKGYRNVNSDVVHAIHPTDKMRTLCLGSIKVWQNNYVLVAGAKITCRRCLFKLDTMKAEKGKVKPTEVKQTKDLTRYIQDTEVNLNRLRVGTLQRASSAKLTQWRESFVMNAEAVSYELSKMTNALRGGVKSYFGNPDLKFKTSNIFKAVFRRALEFNELFSTRRFHVDTRLLYCRINEFDAIYKIRYEEWYSSPAKKKDEIQQKKVRELKEKADKLGLMPRRHLIEAMIGNIKICRLIKIEQGERLEDHLYDVFGPDWEKVVKSSLYCNIKDVFVEKTSEVVFNEEVGLEEIN